LKHPPKNGITLKKMEEDILLVLRIIENPIKKTPNIKRINEIASIIFTPV
jgi:hypothetical protein